MAHFDPEYGDYVEDEADQSEPCEHCGSRDGSFLDDNNAYVCYACGKAVAVVCPLCGGEGFMEEANMECDWVNYGNDLVTCRECGGKGWTADPSFQ